jgi:hypothetical protein
LENDDKNKKSFHKDPHHKKKSTAIHHNKHDSTTINKESGMETLMQ